MLQIEYQCFQVSNSELRIYDTTGTYNATTNPGGWGTPNPALADVTSAYLLFESNTYTTAIQLDIVFGAGLFGSTDIEAAAGMSILSSTVFGSSVTTFPDGYYKITMIVVAGGITYDYTMHEAFVYNARCCARQKAMNTVIPIQNAAQIIEGALMNYMVDALGYAACCGNTDAFTNIQNYLTELCEDCGRYTTVNSVAVPCGCH